MPRNSSGVYSLPAGTTATTRTTISSTAYNTFLSDLVTAITASLNVNGTAPMLAALNMSNSPINNVADPSNLQDAATKNYVDGGSGNMEITVALTNVNVTLTAAQGAARYITFTGALTGNVTVIFPTTPVNFCYVQNNTTGAYNITLNVSGGGSLTLPQPSLLPSLTFTNPLPIFHDGTNITNLYAPPVTPLSFRNVIINGGMAVDQRNSGASQTITAGAALAYTVDRWWASCTGANVSGKCTASGTNPDQYYYQFTGAASVTAIQFGQRIESYNSYHLAGQTCTLSAKIANGLLTTVNWAAYYANTADTFGTLASPTKTLIASGSFTGVSSSTQTLSTQIAIPSGATTGIEVIFSVGAQTSGTWTITDVQLEPGNVATTFERIPLDVTLQRCLRYYWDPPGALQPRAASNASGSGVSIFLQYAAPIPMRATPTVSASWGTLVNCAAGAVTALGDSRGVQSYITSSGAGNFSGYFTITSLSAEL